MATLATLYANAHRGKHAPYSTDDFMPRDVAEEAPTPALVMSKIDSAMRAFGGVTQKRRV